MIVPYFLGHHFFHIGTLFSHSTSIVGYLYTV